MINPNEDIDYTVVSPAPPTATSPTEVHVIIHQRTRPFECPSLVTTYDNGVMWGRPYTTALYLPAAVKIIRETGKSFSCPPHLPNAACNCWHGGQELQPGQRFPNRNGFSFILIIHRQLQENIWDGGEAAGSMSLLQTTLRKRQIATEERLTVDAVAQAQRPSETKSDHDAEIGMQKIDLHDAIVAFEQFDAHFFLPNLHLPEIQSWHVASTWTTIWWDFCTPGSELWIYYDGSAIKSPQLSVSAAAVAFLKIQHTWVFAGAISTPLPFAEDSYAAEHFASAISLKMRYDILKIHEACGAPIPDLHFCFDSLTVGHQTAGLWHCFKHPTLGAALRNIHRLIETRFDPNIFHWHVRGHVGHPGNELADTLAYYAHGAEANSTTGWLASLDTHAFVDASSWFWILFDNEYQPLWHQHQLRFKPPTTTPDDKIITDLLPPANPLAETDFDDCCDLCLRLATCNVLSLCGQHDDVGCGISGPGRQQMLLRQLHEEGIHIFALQETRLRRLHHAHSEHFFLFRSAANEKGHFGIMVGITKTLPYAISDSNRKERRHRFHEDNFLLFSKHQEV